MKITKNEGQTNQSETWLSFGLSVFQVVELYVFHWWNMFSLFTGSYKNEIHKTKLTKKSTECNLHVYKSKIFTKQKYEKIKS